MVSHQNYLSLDNMQYRPDRNKRSLKRLRLIYCQPVRKKPEIVTYANSCMSVRNSAARDLVKTGFWASLGISLSYHRDGTVSRYWLPNVEICAQCTPEADAWWMGQLYGMVVWRLKAVHQAVKKNGSITDLLVIWSTQYCQPRSEHTRRRKRC